MARQNSYKNILKFETKETAACPSHKRALFMATLLALLLALLLVLSLAAVTVLYFQKERKLQELEGVVGKIRTTLQRSNVSYASATKSESSAPSNVQLLENIHEVFSEIQAHLEDAQAQYSDVVGLVSSGWMFHNGSFYFFYKEAKSWQEAEQTCASHGAHLTSVTSRQEMEYLSREAQKSPFWIGLTDQQQEGNWTWVDGTKYDTKVSFWASGQPDNWHGAPGYQENCVLVTTHWNDVSCSYHYKWFCKKAIRSGILPPT
ncbi:C-type lectin domain family 4 member F-like [Hemicordylus capensis]|uniref:C-type lectin domain family 4 member F-like n=1 Tax=Hemicordylus capensis TaxID=884348 RepID=UPI002304C32E|nr:C-type lectin domain family 4 member F-like [Hemicordylus capensis]